MDAAAQASAASSAAQAPPAAAAPPAVPLPPTAGFQDGFFIQTANGDYRLLIGILAQTDGRFSLVAPPPIIDSFTIRKLRPIFAGRVARYFDFRVMPDFGNGSPTLADAYLDVRFSPKFRVRTGKDKTPIGYEMLIGDAFLLFPERSQASSLVPIRDVGVQVQGDLSPKLYYAGGVFNGVPDGTSSTTDVDTNNGKDLAGRIVVQPFRKASNNGPLSGFGFQVAGSVGDQVGALPTFKTSVGQTYFTYGTGAAASGNRTRATAAVAYYYKSLGLFSEYMRSTQEVSRLSRSETFTNTGWDISGSVLLTGETASVGIIRPNRPFDPPLGKWGALQIVSRYARLALDQDIFPDGFGAVSTARRAREFTIGANWYPASVIKYYATYERTAFETGVPPARPVEHVVLFRIQLGI
jgi:phosphate-selective porin OprO/OprP